MLTQEMGFSMIAQVMIETMHDKPLIGHNPMYDILYFYNQFVDILPNTYLEFIRAWNIIFGKTYDSKIVAYQNKTIFPKSVLSDIFQKTETDEKIKDNMKFKFDEKNNMTKYMPQQP